MQRPAQYGWGDWLLARARVVGFQRQSDLARSVGCTREQIGRWGAMACPPRQMRKGFDANLAYALQTTREVLFTQWKHIPPNKADRILLHPDQLTLGDFDFFPAALPAEELLQMVVRLLAPSEVEWLLRQVALKVLEAGEDDQRTAIFRRIVERFKLFEHFAATGERLPSAPAPGPDASTTAAPAAPSPGPARTQGIKISRVELEAAEVKRRTDKLNALAARVDATGHRLLDELRHRTGDELKAKLASNSMIPTAEAMAAFEAEQAARKTAAAERDRLAALHAGRKRAKSPDPPPRR